MAVRSLHAQVRYKNWKLRYYTEQLPLDNYSTVHCTNGWAHSEFFQVRAVAVMCPCCDCAGAALRPWHGVAVTVHQWMGLRRVLFQVLAVTAIHAVS